jgi:hypothetical protein
MLLAEELLLLGLDPSEGTGVSARQELLVGLAGALVGELALAGLVDLAGERFIAVGTPTGGPAARGRAPGAGPVPGPAGRRPA